MLPKLGILGTSGANRSKSLTESMIPAFVPTDRIRSYMDFSAPTVPEKQMGSDTIYALSLSKGEWASTSSARTANRTALNMLPLFLRLVVEPMPSTRLAQLTPNPRLVGRHVHDVLARRYALRGLGARRRHALKDRFFRMRTISATCRLCAWTVIVAPASTCRSCWLSRALSSRTLACMVVTKISGCAHYGAPMRPSSVSEVLLTGELQLRRNSARGANIQVHQRGDDLKKRMDTRL